MAQWWALLTLVLCAICSAVTQSALGQSDPEVVEVEVGVQSVTLPAQTQFQGTITSVLWTRGTENVHLIDQEGFDDRNQSPLFKDRTQMRPDALKNKDLSLVLKYPTLTDSGTYTCVVRDGIKDVDRISVELRVTGQAVAVVLGHKVTLPFVWRVLPADAQVKWTRGSEVVHLRVGSRDDLSSQSSQFKGRTQMKSDALQSGDLSLTLENGDTSDSGWFTCVVRQGNTELARTSVDLDVRPSNAAEGAAIGLGVGVPVLLGAILSGLTYKRKKETKDSWKDAFIGLITFKKPTSVV